jgi:FkbM family methyltransferase
MDFKDYFAAPEHVVADTEFGPMLCFRNDTGVSDKLIRYGTFAAGELSLYRRLLAPGDTVVDVGANIGVISAALQRDRQGYQIWAFEPQPALHAAAAVNLAGGVGARLFPYAVGARDGLIDLPVLAEDAPSNFGGARIDGPAAQTVPVPMVRLDTLLPGRANPPRLIKIDVEGMEADVLEGARGLFHPGLILSIEADQPEQVERWLPRLLADCHSCYLVFSVNVLRTHPRFDPDDARARVRAAQVVACVGAPPRDLLDVIGGYRITSMDYYRERLPLPATGTDAPQAESEG